jgi:hypothetical protein
MDETQRLRELVILFGRHYVCEPCYEMAATYLDNCKNPLHALHDYLYELDLDNG